MSQERIYNGNEDWNCGMRGISHVHGNAVRQSDYARIGDCADVLINRAKEYAIAG